MAKKRMNEGVGHGGFVLDSFENDPDNIMQSYMISMDTLQHLQGELSIDNFLIGWPCEFEIDPPRKEFKIEIIDISVSEFMSKFLPNGFQDKKGQKKMLEIYEGL